MQIMFHNYMTKITILSRAFCSFPGMARCFIDKNPYRNHTSHFDRSNSRLQHRVLLRILLTLFICYFALFHNLPTAAAQISTTGACIDNATGKKNQCTANDVHFGTFSIVQLIDGCTSPRDTFTAQIKAEIQAGQAERYDIGLWVNTNGNSALTGNQCYRQILSPLVASPFATLNLTGGNGPFRDLEDVGGDVCGDISDNETAFINLQPLTFQCSDTDNNGMVDISACVSWDNLKSQTCGGVGDALPNTGSKCSCPPPFTVNVPIPDLSLSKSCTPDQVAAGGAVSCTITYINNGIGDAVGFSLVDDYDQSHGAVSPIGTTNPGDQSGADNGDTITWLLPTIPGNGGTGSVTYQYRVAADVPGDTQIANTATIYYGDNPQDVATEATITVIDTGSITLVKQTDPDGRASSFAFTSSHPPTSFTLTDNGAESFTQLPAGIYTFAETPLADWDLSNIGCSGAGSSTVQIGDNAGFDSGDTDVTVNLAAGENITCTFTNAIQRGHIIVVKETLPDGAGQSFDFTSNYGPQFSLTDGQSNDSGLLLPGSYRVGEALPPGWVQERVTCTDGSNPAEINLSPGETVTCTFTNQQQAPGIGIAKYANQTLINSGDTVVYSYVVTNQGEAPLSNMMVTDDKCASVAAILTNGTAYNVGDTDQDGFLEGVEQWQYTCTMPITADTTNTATVSADTPFGDTTSAIDSLFVDVRPTIRISKSADPTSVPETGEDVTFTFVVTNSSPESVTLNQLTDSIFGDLDGEGTCSTPQTILSGGSYNCAVTQPIAGDFPGSHTNRATAIATDDEGNVATAGDEAVVNYSDVIPAVTITKRATPLTRQEPGGIFTFTLTIVNESLEAATITTLTDDYPLSTSCLALVNKVLAYQEAATCTYQVIQSAPGDYVNTAIVTVADRDGNSATDRADASFTVTDLPASLRVVKSATPTTMPEPGGPVLFALAVTNQSTVDVVTLTTITDDTDNDGVIDLTFPASTICTTTTLLPGATTVCTFPTRTMTGNAGDLFTDLAAANGTDDDGHPVSAQDTATVTLTDVASKITVTKSANPASLPEPGGPVVFTIQVVNVSPADQVTINQLTDSVFGDITTIGHDGLSATSCSVPQSLVASGGSYSCSFTAAVSGNFGEDHENIVVVGGLDNDNNPVNGSDSAKVVIINRPSYLEVTKSANVTQVPESGADVTYSVVVRNISAVDHVTVTQVIDNQFGNVGNSCQPTLPHQLAPNSTLVCTFTRFIQGDAGTTHTNVATANGIDDDNTPVTGADDTTVTFVDTPSTLAVVKQASPTQVPEAGGNVQFTVRIANTSAADNVVVDQVTDSVFGDISATCSPQLPVDLPPGASITCTFIRFLSGDVATPHTNVATASGVDDDNVSVSGSDIETVTFADTLAAATITKSPNRTSVPQEGAEVIFTIRLENTSAVDSITFTNLLDSIYGNVANADNNLLLNTTCAVPQTVPAGQSYSCQFSALISGAIGDVHSNVVTATGRDEDGSPIIVNDDAMIVIADPLISATKSDALVTDQDGNGLANPGDLIGYTIVIRNSGNAPALTTFLDDLVDVNATLVVGSVTTSQGSVVSGNLAGQSTVAVDIGDIVPQGSVTIKFTVTIDNPLPEGVTRILNQGLITGLNFPTVLTDDPATPADADPTVTPVVGHPLLSATKSAAVVVDPDNNGVASPGDILEYQIAIVNSGDQAALATFVNDQLDPNVTLLVGSVQSSQGTVVSGNTAGDTMIQVTIGTLPGDGATAVIRFRVSINNPLLASVINIVNQALIRADNTPTVVTDDPETSDEDDATLTPITASPQLNAVKQVHLVVDADQNGLPSPGDTLIYNITIQNVGNQEATGLVFTDTPDPNTKLIVGSVQVHPGLVVTGNNPGNSTIRATIDNLPGGGEATLSYRVMVNNPLEVGITRIENQGIIQSNELPDIPTDDPSTPLATDPTQTTVIARPRLIVNKVDFLWDDADDSGTISPGDALLYQITIANRGNATAPDVIMVDEPDPNTTLIVGTVQSDRGVIIQGNNPGDTAIRVELGDLPAGEVAVITFRVQIKPDLDSTEVANQALVTYVGGVDDRNTGVPSNDPENEKPDDPTRTPVVKGPTALDPSDEPEPGSPSGIIEIFLPMIAR